MVRVVRRCLLAAVLATAIAAPRPAGAQQAVDLELLLAVDASSSVDRWEFELQMQGIAQAFRHPDVSAALRSVGDRGIAVALMQWSGSTRQAMAVEWTRIDGDASALAFADKVAVAPRLVVSGGTAIGTALRAATAQLFGNAFQGARQVIDVSGDGRANMGPRPDIARDLAVRQGITINGLAILNEEWALDRYYLENVIGGTGAFIMEAANYEDFALAIKQKIVREISGAPIVRTPLPTGPGRPGTALVRLSRPVP